ncbi:MAG: hypothetical protein J7L66_01735, partial [Anaerolineaceae bacterium]|nr:hypothetical protein [Anaerolineaceae bacterium]
MIKNNLSNQREARVIKSALVIVFISGIANCAYLLTIPSDAKNALIFNLSVNRLLLALFLLFGISLSLFAFLAVRKSPDKCVHILSDLYQKPIWTAAVNILLAVFTCLTWVVFFSPSYLLGDYYSIAERTRPLLLWALTDSLVLFMLGVYINGNYHFNTLFSNRKFIHRFAAALAAIISLTVLVIIFYPKLTDDLWFGRYSVPILATQVLFSWTAVIIIKQIISGLELNIPAYLTRHIDWIAFILIWIISMILWVRQPIQFMDDMYYTAIEQHLRPLPPVFEIFPHKDSRTYYQITESVRIGKGIYRSIDKSLFLAVESCINWLAGGSYVKMLNLQVILLAVFPSIVYLIGKELHSREAGLLGAMLAVLQEINGIQIMDEFPVVSSKVLLSEPYMQLWNGLIVLSAISAFKKQTKKQGIAFLLCGSALGLSALFRLNTVVAIPFILLVILIKYFKKKKILLKNAVLFLLGIQLAFTPWMMHNCIKYGNPLMFINAKVRGVIIQKRYEKITGKNDFVLEFPGHSSVAWDTQSAENNLPVLLASIVPNVLERKQPEALLGDETETLEISLPSPNTSNFRAYLPDPKYLKLSLSVLRHFLNNIITSFSILPSAFSPQDLFHGARTQQFWGSYDANLYMGINPVLIILNLMIVSAGIAKAFEKNKVIGLIPAAVYLGYHLSNGLALSSGNRYAQPASWTVFFYFGLGLVVVSDRFFGLVH